MPFRLQGPSRQGQGMCEQSEQIPHRRKSCTKNAPIFQKSHSPVTILGFVHLNAG